MRKTIATVSVSGALEEKLAAITAAKFDGVEIFDNDLIASPLRPSQVRQRCLDLGLSIDLFQPVHDVEGVTPAHFPRVLRRVHHKLNLMEELGCTTMLLCSNAAITALSDASLAAQQLNAVAEAASDHGVTVAYEALAWGTHVNRLRDAWALIAAVDHSALTLAVDTFHLLARGDGAHELANIPGERIGFLQVADAPVLGMDLLEWSRHHRVFPGQGAFDLVSVVAAVVEAGYRGPLSLEVFSDVVRDAEPHVTALDAMRSVLHLEEELRRRWENEATRPSSRPRVELFDPPPAPSPVDFAFVEAAVHHENDLEPLLQAMGFAQVGQHRTKQVSWWRNGGANVLLNAASDLEDRWGHATARPSLTGVGLAVSDVAAIAARRAALLWPSLPLRRQGNEASLVGVDSPAGVHTFVAGAAGSDADWQQDFTPVDATAGEASDTGDWLGIDHIGYAVPFALSEAEISYHRTLFGMLPSPIAEFANPRGRLRSRVMRPAKGSARVVLNVSDGIPRVPTAHLGLNQVAFGCPDVIAAAHRLRAAGVGLLQIPENYYEDLDARFDLPSGRLAELRSAGAMYDRDATGEMLHIYTRLIAANFYIELIQRNNYDAYGAANTPVRLIAQSTQPLDARPMAARTGTSYAPPPARPL